MASVDLAMKPRLSKELAEFVGIMFGDGSMNHYSNGHYFVEVYGDSRRDLDYHKYIASLIRKLFSIEPTTSFRKNQNTICTRISSKRVFNELLSVGVTKGSKDTQSIPSWISGDLDFVTSFLRGLFDTDGSVILRTRGQHSLSLGLKDSCLVDEVGKILSKLGYFVAFAEHLQKDKRGFESKTYCLRVNQKKLIRKFYEEIGSSNPYKIERLEKIGDGTPGTFKALAHS